MRRADFGSASANALTRRRINRLHPVFFTGVCIRIFSQRRFRRELNRAEAGPGKVFDSFAPVGVVVVAADESLDHREFLRPLVFGNLNALEAASQYRRLYWAIVLTCGFLSASRQTMMPSDGPNSSASSLIVSPVSSSFALDFDLCRIDSRIHLEMRDERERFQVKVWIIP